MTILNFELQGEVGEDDLFYICDDIPKEWKNKLPIKAFGSLIIKNKTIPCECEFEAVKNGF